MTSTRRLGAALIAVAAMALVVVAQARPIAGHAARVPPPGPPSVGDCLTVPADTVARSWDDLPGQEQRTLPLAPCRGQRYGEVVSLVTDDLPDALFAATPDHGDIKNWLAPAGNDCDRAARAQQNLPATIQGWELSSPIQTFFLPPTREQMQAGQRWMACIAHTNALIDRPLADLPQIVQPRDGYGTCVVSPADWEPLPCTSAHRTELFGFRDWDAGHVPTQADLDRSCRAVLTAMLGTTDITRAGQLGVSVPVWHWTSPDAPIELGVRPGLAGQANCAVTTFPPRTLIGALLFLRNRRSRGGEEETHVRTPAAAVRMSRMTLQVRTITDDEVGAWASALGTGFHQVNQDVDGAFRRKTIVLDRTWATFDHGRAVATLRSFPGETTVPGGVIDASLITAVATTPTHRRRGLASAMMTRELRASRDRGEVAATLIAAEYPIYGRFGFGPAAWNVDWTVDARGTLPGPWRPEGSVELVDIATGRPLASTLQDQARLRRPGDFRWPERFSITTSSCSTRPAIRNPSRSSPWSRAIRMVQRSGWLNIGSKRNGRTGSRVAPPRCR